MALHEQRELALRKQILKEMIGEVERAIHQFRRTQEGLQQRIEMEEHHRQSLVAKLESLAVQNRSDDEALSIADYVAKILYECGGPMHIREIVDALEQCGVTSEAQNGPLNSVMSALSRRSDLFRRIDRGQYALRESVERKNRLAHS